jgi:predicted negative regulator of RcsB-dependent stress response
MAALDLQEQEQLEEFKAWWKDNRNFILGSLIVAVVTIGGWRGWQYYHHNQSTQAAMLYSEFVKQLEGNDAGRVNDAAAAVMDRFGSTAYASRAALLAAQVNEHDKDATRAKAQLQWVIDHAGEAELRDVARLRLASLLLDEAKYAEAISLLNVEHSASFDGLYGDLRGDVLSAQGKPEEARSAYKLALEKTDPKSMYRNLIQMKLDALVTSK